MNFFHFNEEAEQTRWIKESDNFLFTMTLLSSSEIIKEIATTVGKEKNINYFRNFPKKKQR